MRKKTIKFGLDNIFWYIIYLLPILITIAIYLGCYQGDWLPIFVQDGGSVYDYDQYPIMYIFNDIMQYRFGFNGESLIATTLWSIVGVDGILPFIVNTDVYGSALILYMEYFVCVYLIHLVIDFILFIPRLCHKWLNAFTRTED